MKEASGELSVTAITVVAIAAIATLFITLIYPRIKASITNNANCAAAFNCGTPGDNGMMDCQYYDESNSISSIQCPDQS